MNPIEIIAEFEERSKSAGKYRGLAALFLIISIVSLALYGIYRERIPVWGSGILAAGVMLMVIALALSLLSFVKLRCPNCDRVLGEIYNATFCPSCGAALKSAGPVGLDTDGEKVEPVASRRIAGERAITRRADRRIWQPRDGSSGMEEFPGEAYPKNIRLFTTPDEMELTKRFIHLIDRDDNRLQAEQGGNITQKAAGSKSNIARKPAADRETKKPEDRQSWSRIDRKSPEEESLDNLGVFARLLLKIRRL